MPLHSTRADVERLLGPPVQGTRNVYHDTSQTITVTYSSNSCDHNWRVPVDSVINLLVHPTIPLKLADLGVVESKFEKRRDEHLAIYYYVNTNEGINYTVDFERGQITAMEFYPATRDSHLKCSGSSPAAGRPSTKSRNQLRNRAARKRTKTVSFVCPMHADVVSSKAGACHRCGMRLIKRSLPSGEKPGAAATASGVSDSGREPGVALESFPNPGTRPWSSLSTKERVLELERLAPTYEYTCLMHSEVHEAQQGSCPKCGMPLTIIQPSVLGDYKLLLTPDPLSPRPAEKVTLRFVVSDPVTGEAVKNYVVNHEKLFHLFIVSDDLAEYQHVHPELQPDGSFSVETTLPRHGVYKLHADFFPVGGTPQVIHRELLTFGHRLASPRVKPVLQPDSALVKVVDGMRITLKPGRSLIAGALIPLSYQLEDENTGKPVTDLEPYLGAWGHTLILNEDQSEYLHSHPSDMLSQGADRATVRGGPQVEFKAMFPSAGDYRIWTQFQRAGRVTTVSFTVRTQRGPSPEAGSPSAGEIK